MNRRLIYTPAFIREVKRAGKGDAAANAAIGKVLVRLEADAYDPRLRTHKLRGELSDSWSCSAGYDLRILFQFTTQDGVEMIVLTACGTHDEVY